MANNHSTLTGLFADIADAIREKTGSDESIVADEFPEAIAAIEAGGGDTGWVLFDSNGEVMTGEVVEPEAYVSSYATSPHNQYRVTLDGVSEVVWAEYPFNIYFKGGHFEREEGDPTVYFDDWLPHAFKVESWMGTMPLVLEILPFTISADVNYISGTTKTATISGVELEYERYMGQLRGYPSVFGFIYANENSGSLQFKCNNFAGYSVSLPAGDYELLVYSKDTPIVY